MSTEDFSRISYHLSNIRIILPTKNMKASERAITPIIAFIFIQIFSRHRNKSQNQINVLRTNEIKF